MRGRPAAALAAALVLLTSGCATVGTESDEPTAARSTTSPTPAAPAPPLSAPATGPPRSQLIDVQLPVGSTPSGGDSVPDIEIWHVPLEVPEAVAYLRPQLPINGSLNGVPWCEESTNSKTDLTTWSWASATEWIVVGVGRNYPKVGVRGPGSEVSITRSQDMEGCGPPDASTAADNIPSDGTYQIYADVEPGLWETDGARGDARNSQRCMWMRLFEPEASLSNMIDGGGADVGERIQVRIDPEDVAFNTHGCKPWHRIGD
jgi:hypothetical protein